MAEQGRWLDHKKHLAEKGFLHPIFVDLHRISFDRDQAQYFEPLLIARQAQRMGELVDRCLAMRKDIRELEILAVKAATDYLLFKDTSPIDERIDVLRLLIQSKDSDQAGFEKAAAAFGTASSLEKGLAEIARGRDAALAADIGSSDEIQSLIATRWQKLREYQDSYHAKHTEPGNAHNYAERVETLLQVLTVLMQEALARANALVAGVKQVYGTELSGVPSSVTLQTVDQFAMWALKAIQSLSRAAEQESVSEIIIPLVQPWLQPGRPLMTPERFDLQIREGVAGRPILLPFELPNNGLLDPRARLKAVGVSFGNEFNILASGIDRNETADAYTRLAVKVSTPQQVAADGSTFQRPPFLIGAVGLHGPHNAGPTIDGNPIENISPFGSWTIEIHPRGVWKDRDEHLVYSDTNYSGMIKDMKLSLRFYVPGNIVQPFADQGTLSTKPMPN